MRPFKRRRKLLYVLASFIVAFCLIEVFLRFTSIGATGPLFERRVNAGGIEQWVTSGWAKREGFADNVFNVKKLPGKVRVFILGGSAAKGVHWDPRGTPARWLELLANSRDPMRRFEVVNLGFVGANIQNVQNIIKNLQDYAPDILVIYSGDNEFLAENPWILSKMSRTDSPLGEMRLVGAMERLAGLWRGWLILRENRYTQNDVGQWLTQGKKLSDAKLAGNIVFFRDRLTQIIDQARLTGRIVIVCSVPSNLRDWAPNASSTRNPSSLAERGNWIAQVEEGKRLLKTNTAAAKSIFEDLIRRDSTVAEAHYWLGMANLYEKNFDEARTAFIEARDLDDMPTRILSPINDAIREAVGNRVYLADAEKIFREQAQWQITGYDLFDDACHPNLKGQYLLASSMRDALFKATGIDFPAPTTVFDTEEFKQGMDALGITPEYAFGKLTFIGFFLGLRSLRPRTERAINVFEQASQSLPGYKYVLAAAGLLSLFEKNIAAAQSYFNEAFSEGPERVAIFSREYFPDNLMWQSPIFIADARRLESAASLRLNMMWRGKSTGKVALPPLNSFEWGAQTRIYVLSPQTGIFNDITNQVLERIHNGQSPLPEIK